MQPSTCKLCLKDAVLIDSHIIPAWAWRRARAEHLQSPHPVQLGSGAAIQTPKQVSERMLCRSCEDLMKVGEDYAAEVTFGRDYATAPLLDRVGLWLYEEERFRVVPAGSLDASRLAYFGLSVVWRASVAACLPECEVGPDREETLRLYLLDHGPPPDDVTCCATFYDLPYEGTTHVASIFMLPYTEADASITFLLYGLRYIVQFGDRATEWRPLCLVHGPERVLTLAPQEYLLDEYGEWFKRQVPRGALARRGVR